MLTYLAISFQIVFPIVCYMAAGYLACHRGWADAHAFEQLNRLCFRLLLPVSLFMQISQTDFRSAFHLDLVVMMMLGTIGVYLLCELLMPHFVPSGDVSAVVQGIYRSNGLSFALAIVGNMYPNSSLGAAAVLCAFGIPTYNVLAVILFEAHSGRKADPKTLLLSIVKNPLIIAGFLGTLFSIARVELPAFLLTPLNGINHCAVPLVMMSLGASFSFNSLRHYKRQLLITMAGRLVIVPGLMLVIGILYGFRGIMLSSLFVLFASPTATSSYPMAQEMGGNGELAGDIVASTSVMSVLTLFLWIFLLNILHLT